MNKSILTKFAIAMGFVVLPVGCFIKSIYDDHQDIADKQAFLDQHVEFKVNGNDTTFYYRLTGDELKKLMNFKHADKLEIK